MDERSPGPSPGQSIGSYQVVRKLGSGGMGSVYEAVHRQLGRRAALKVLHRDLCRREDLVQRLFNEARAVNVLSHPGLVNIFEMGRLPDGAAYLLMEYLPGETLGARLLRMGGRLPDAVRICRQIASILTAAHEHGVVHRDIKPENVMIVPDPEVPGGERVKLLDFGIAKLRGTTYAKDGIAAASETRVGTVLGTPVYMAPEQCRGCGGIDERADVYSLGIVLYEALSGRPPFFADAPGVLMAMHLTEAPPDLWTAAPELPQPLCALVLSMLAKHPDDRPTMRAVAGVLSRMEAQAATPKDSRRSFPSLAPPSSQATPPPVSRTIVRTDVLGGRSKLRVALLGAGLSAAAIFAVATIEERAPPGAPLVQATPSSQPAVPPAQVAPKMLLLPPRRGPVLALPAEVPAVEPAPAGWPMPVVKAPRRHRITPTPASPAAPF